jgi:hypothetical protein
MPRQPKRHVVGEEWTRVQQQANTSHQCPVFFVSDRIKSGEMNVECCPTGEMVADFFTKPLLLERNGCGSSSKRTRHINVRHFFVSDRIKSGEMNVEHCPTGEMVADFFTKPLQGAKFTKFRNLIMNI